MPGVKHQRVETSCNGTCLRRPQTARKSPERGLLILFFIPLGVKFPGVKSKKLKSKLLLLLLICIETVHYCQNVFGCELPSVLNWQQDMINSLRKSYVPLFSC